MAITSPARVFWPGSSDKCGSGTLAADNALAARISWRPRLPEPQSAQKDSLKRCFTSATAARNSSVRKPPFWSTHLVKIDLPQGSWPNAGLRKQLVKDIFNAIYISTLVAVSRVKLLVVSHHFPLRKPPTGNIPAMGFKQPQPQSFRRLNPPVIAGAGPPVRVV